MLFTAAQALFDEYLFPRCPKSGQSRHRPTVLDRRYTPPSEDSTQEDDNDEFDSPSHSHPNPPEKGPDAQRDGAEQQPNQQRSPSPPVPPPEEPPQPAPKPAEEPTLRRSGRTGTRPSRLRDNAMGDRTPGQLA